MEWWKMRSGGNETPSPAAPKPDFEAELVMQRAQLISSDRILDAGCGDGERAMALSVRGFTNITAIDRSGVMIATAKRRAAHRGLRISFAEGDPHHCRFQDGSFDAVLIFENEFGRTQDPQDDTNVLREAMRILRPSGTLILSVVDGDWLCQHYLPDAAETIANNVRYLRRKISDDGSTLTTHELIVDQDSGLSTEHMSVERLYTQSRISTLLHLVGFKAISFGSSKRCDNRSEKTTPRHTVTCRAAATHGVSEPMAKSA